MSKTDLRKIAEDFRCARTAYQLAEQRRQDAILTAVEAGLSPSEIAALLEIARPSVVRIVTKNRARTASTAEPMTQGSTSHEYRAH